MSREIYFYTDGHLGDNIFNYILFYNIRDYLEENNIFIKYSAKTEYHYQIKEFNPSKNVILNEIYETKGFYLWIGNPVIEHNYNYYYNHSKYPFNMFIVYFFNTCLKNLNLSIQITSLKYSDEDLLIRYNNLPEKYKNIDILIVNSTPCSGQYNFNEEDWNIYIDMMKDKYNLVTTKKVGDIKCTLDDNLTIKNIAALSTKVKVIIAINTGVLPGLLNNYTLTNVKKFYVFDDNVGCYNYPMHPIFEKREKLVDITFDELDKYLQND